MKKGILFIVWIALVSQNIVAQCPMCRSAVESSMKGSQKAVGMGLNTGILMLLATVYLVVAVVGGLWYYRFKKSQKHA